MNGHASACVTAFVAIAVASCSSSDGTTDPGASPGGSAACPKTTPAFTDDRIRAALDSVPLPDGVSLVDEQDFPNIDNHPLIDVVVRLCTGRAGGRSAEGRGNTGRPAAEGIAGRRSDLFAAGAQCGRRCGSARQGQDHPIPRCVIRSGRRSRSGQRRMEISRPTMTHRQPVTPRRGHRWTGRR